MRAREAASGGEHHQIPAVKKRTFLGQYHTSCRKPYSHNIQLYGLAIKNGLEPRVLNRVSPSPGGYTIPLRFPGECLKAVKQTNIGKPELWDDKEHSFGESKYTIFVFFPLIYPRVLYRRDALKFLEYKKVMLPLNPGVSGLRTIIPENQLRVNTAHPSYRAGQARPVQMLGHRTPGHRGSRVGQGGIQGGGQGGGSRQRMRTRSQWLSCSPAVQNAKVY